MGYNEEQDIIAQADVLTAERKCINKRREVAFEKGAMPDADEENLVGLALSGGGIRSAMFNRGLLQAFSHRGLLRYVDYLSSVSGGGYIAGWLGMTALSASTCTKRPQSSSQNAAYNGQPAPDANGFEGPSHAAADTDCDDVPDLAKDYSFHGDEKHATLGTNAISGKHLRRSGDDSTAMATEAYAFQRAGKILELRRFLPRYVGYTLPVTLLWLSLWGIVATSLALFWRSFDHPHGFRLYSDALGFTAIANELFIAFIPAVLLAFAWLIVRATILLLEPRGRFQKLAVVLAVGVLGYLIGPLLWVSFTVFAPPVYPRAVDRDSLGSAGALVFAVAWILLAVLFARATIFALVSQFRPMREISPSLDWHRKLSTGTFWGILIACAVSIAVFLGNGYTQTSSQGEELRLNYLAAYLGILAGVLQLVPLLGRGRWIAALQEGADPWKRRVVWLVSWTCLLFPAFAIVHWMASENISGFATHRGPDLVAHDVEDLNGFGQLVQNRLTDTPRFSEQDAERLPRSQLTEYSVKLKEAESKLLGTPHSPQWARYSQRPLITFGGTKNAWRLLLGQPLSNRSHNSRDEGVTLAEYTRSVESTHDELNQQIDCINHRLKTWSLTGHLLKEAAGLVEVDRTTEPSNWTFLSSLFSTTASSPHRAGSVEIGQLFRDRMDYMEDWGNSDRRSFWDNWSHFLALLPDRSSVGEGTIDVLHDDDTNALWTKDEIATFNRQLLELLYPNIIRERSMVSTTIVPAADQSSRWGWLLLWASLSVALFACVDANRDSPFFSYYSERLSHYYLQDKLQQQGKGARRKQLSDFNTWDHGMPYPLFSAALMAQPGDHRDCTFEPFLFSPHFCGNPRTSYAESRFYPTQHQPVTVADAIAVSGAAVTPLMTANSALRLVMRMFNISLGAYVPHPWRVQRDKGTREYPTSYFRVLASIIKSYFAPSPDWKLSFVADGGFRDYLGVEELLRRRCRLIIVSDAGCNEGTNEFSALASFVRLARVEHGVEVLDMDEEAPLNLDRFRRKKEDAPAPQQFLCARIRYHESGDAESSAEVTYSEGLLVYVHMALTGKEDVDLQQFRKRHPRFPYDSTTNQFFTSSQVESYRQLGHHVGSLVCRELPRALDAPKSERRDQWSKPLRIDELVYRIQRGYVAECFRERTFDRTDVRPEGLFQVERNSLTSPSGNTGFSWSNVVIGETVEEALRRYERDADCRLCWRLWIVGDENDGASVQPAAFDGDSGSDDWGISPDSLKRWACPRNLAVALLMCNEEVASMVPLFQVGGRGRLVAIAHRWSERFQNELLQTGLSPERMQHVSNELAADLQSVFRSGAEETISHLFESIPARV